MWACVRACAEKDMAVTAQEKACIEFLRARGFTVSKAKPKTEFFWGDGSKTDVKAARAQILSIKAIFGDGVAITGQIIYDGVTKQYRLGPAARACCDRWRYRMTKHSTVPLAHLDHWAVPPFTHIEIGGLVIDPIQTNLHTADYRGAMRNRYSAIHLQEAA